MEKVINFIKKSKFGQFLYYVRDLYRFPTGNSILKRLKKNKKCVILLGVPTFNNLGDHLIAYSSIEFIKDLYPQNEVIEIPTQFFLKNKEKIIKVLDINIPVFIIGGGWMGNIWEDDEYRMQEMLKAFSNNKIIILPQTVYYDFSKSNAKDVLKDAKNTYKKCKDLTMFFRDNTSYEFAVDNFADKNTRVILAPDIALYCKYKSKNIKQRKISVCLRKDREKLNKLDVNNIVKNYCKENDFTYKKTDTITKYSVPIWKRNKKILKKLKEFSKSTLIITDRLHGMIFALLSNTKCIAFDNKTKKVSGVYKLWLVKNKNIRFLENNVQKNELLEAMDSLIDNTYNDNSWKKQLDFDFNKMTQEIKI